MSCIFLVRNKWWQIPCPQHLLQKILPVGIRSFKDALFKELEVILEQDFIPITAMRLTAMKEAAKKDVEQTVLQKVISDGWPNKTVEVPESARKYWNFREVLTTQDGEIYKGGQVVVPGSLREEILRRLHFKSSRSTVYIPSSERCGLLARHVGRYQAGTVPSTHKFTLARECIVCRAQVTRESHVSAISPRYERCCERHSNINLRHCYR